MRLRTRLLTSAAVVGTLVLPLVPGAPAGAAPTPLDDAVTWLESQQQADGGFEVSQFPGFETPDAILALASAGQTSATWSQEEALAAVEGITTGGETPKDALDAVDDWVDSVQSDGAATAGAKAQQAAKVIVLVTEPLGLDETDFDPSGDTEAAVDLLGAVEAAEGDGSFPGVTSTGKAYVVWALAVLGETVPEGVLAAVAAGQQANGGFNFAGDPLGTGFDPDITATVVSALAMAGKTTANDATLRRAVIGLGLQQRWNGEWAGEFDDGNPNSTGVTILAAAALCGPDVDEPAWRDAGDVRLSGLPYPSPTAALLARQDGATGRFTSPSDAFGVNTFATSQAIQGLTAAEGRTPYETPSCTSGGALGNRRTVHALYVDLLVRLADEGGADYWTAQFDGGMSPALLAKRFAGSPEYAGRVVERLYRQYLGRPATPEEREADAALITDGGRMQLIARLLASQEYYDNTAPTFPSGPATDETWAEALFQSITGRPAGEGDVDFILDQLQAGRTRHQITRSILNTVEGRGVLVREIYRQLLRRNPSAADRAYWGGELGRGVSPERLVTLIAGSAEYRASTQA
jgi:hypothetical protein